MTEAQKTIVVPLDDEELKDLEEYCRHHPEVGTPADALKKMAGLKLYRFLKEKTDKDRKKPSILPQDVGIPMTIPCALGEELKSKGITYEQFINEGIMRGLGMMKKTRKVRK